MVFPLQLLEHIRARVHGCYFKSLFGQRNGKATRSSPKIHNFRGRVDLLRYHPDRYFRQPIVELAEGVFIGEVINIGPR